MSFDQATYDRIREGAKKSAAAVVPEIYDLVKPETVIDVGGGEGWWAREFAVEYGCSCLVLDEGIEEKSGSSGSVETFWPGEVGYRYAKLDTLDDILLPTPPAGRFDLALCLEVGEHLASEFAEPLVSLLCQLAPVVLWSAAIPSQGGVAHLNEQWPAYWHRFFLARDYVCVDLRHRFWDDERVEPWYRQNLLLYADQRHWLVQEDAVVEHVVGVPLSLVHPTVYGWRVEERDDLLAKEVT